MNSHHSRTGLGIAFVLSISSMPCAQSFTNFESPSVHPITVSQDGDRLLVANTPDNRLAVYSIAQPQRPVLLREIFVGLEPVSVRMRTNDEAWVVNYLSDSVSVVNIKQGLVTATLRVVDEPVDVAFAAGKAFVSTCGSDAVTVFDAVTHQALGRIEIFGDEPRHLVASPDGKTVWVVVHRSGNGSTVLPLDQAPKPPRPTNRRLPTPPQVSLIIDSEDPTWTGKHDVVLPDHDLVEIDAATQAIRKTYRGIGTNNFGAALRPGTKEVWVANTQALNTVRFITALRGHAVDNRVTRVDTDTNQGVTSFDLNPGIDYSTLPNNAALSTALAQPVALAWDRTGSTLYVAALGTDRIGVLNASGVVQSRIEVGDTPGTKVDSRNKRGPHGLAMHPTANWMYVFNRLSNSVTVIDTARSTVETELALADPTPTNLKQGRGFLYDAKLSGNGTFSCASCHVSADIDGLAWDLGDPGGDMFRTTGLGGSRIDLHPMKGPMTTQTLKGLKGTGPFHWRGDKPSISDFNSAFDTLMGKSTLDSSDMDSLVAFIESIAFPPNPNRTLANQLPNQSARDGEHLYSNVPFNGTVRCIDCHSLGSGTNGMILQASILQGTQAMKTSQLRNIYKRDSFLKTSQGRKAGFGLTHDGESQDLVAFLSKPVFGNLAGNLSNKRKVADFVMAWDTGIAPSVGFQITVDKDSLAAGKADILALITRTHSGDADLICKGLVDGLPRGFVYSRGQQRFLSDSSTKSSKSIGELEALVKAGDAHLTFTGVLPLTGRRLGIDRDQDGILDGDEGVSTYGQGTAGCVGTPTITVSSEPKIGNTGFSLVGENAPNQSFGIVGLSGAPSSLRILGVDLLIDIVNPGALLFDVVSDARGTLALPLPIPEDLNLVGLTLFGQVLWKDACGPQGLSATQGLRITVSK
jgi:DNA-binding beta-propeller fold protein YncE